MLVRILIALIAWVGLMACAPMEGAMREGFNLNISVELVDNESCEVSVRHLAGDYDEEIIKLDLPVGDVGSVTEVVTTALTHVISENLCRNFDIINAAQEEHMRSRRMSTAFKSQEEPEIQETWVCRRCEFVNVIDKRCAKCGVERKGDVS